MLLRIHRLRKNEDGQAIVLAALGMLILAIAVLATVNLGHAIQERIRLQNIADSTAYSLAAVEARSFNYFAFVNRAQVSHYVSAMSFQSWLAVIWFFDAAFWTATDLLGDVISVLCYCLYLGATIVGAKIAALCAQVKSILQPIYESLKNVANFWREAANKADKVIGGTAIPACYVLNRAGMYGAQMLMKNVVMKKVTSGGFDIATENDPKLKKDLLNPTYWIEKELNVQEYSKAFDTTAESLSKDNLEDDNTFKARRVMNETANATRWGWFITNRSLSGFLPEFENTPLNLVKGQTRMIDVLKDAPRDEKRFGSEFGHAQMTKGNVLVADQVFKISLGEGLDWIKELFPIDDLFGEDDLLASVWAAPQDQGFHYYYKSTEIPSLAPGCEPLRIPGGVASDDPANHPWEGVVSFIKFNPNSQEKSFHQPSTFSFLNKQPDDIGGQAYVQQFDFTLGKRSESIDTQVGEKPLINWQSFKGLNAWSRAMVYYHRPSSGNNSNWKEHPNFFNPFWRAKLAPLGDKVTELIGQAGFPEEVTQIFVDELITH